MILGAFFWCLIKNQVLDYCGVTPYECFNNKLVQNNSLASALIIDVHFLLITITQISFVNRIHLCPIDCQREREREGIAALITVSG